MNSSFFNYFFVVYTIIINAFLVVSVEEFSYDENLNIKSNESKFIKDASEQDLLRIIRSRQSDFFVLVYKQYFEGSTSNEIENLKRNLENIVSLFKDSSVNIKPIYVLNLTLNPDFELVLKEESKEIKNVSFFYYDKIKMISFNENELNNINSLSDWILNKYLIQEKVVINDYIKTVSDTEMKHFDGKPTNENLNLKEKEKEKGETENGNLSEKESETCKEDYIKIVEDGVAILEDRIHTIVESAENIKQKFKEKLKLKKISSSNSNENFNPIIYLFMIFILFIFVAGFLALKRFKKNKNKVRLAI